MYVDVWKVHRCVNNFESVDCTWNTLKTLLHTLTHAIRYLRIYRCNEKLSFNSQYLQLLIILGFIENVHFLQKAYCLFSQFSASPKK